MSLPLISLHTSSGGHRRRPKTVRYEEIGALPITPEYCKGKKREKRKGASVTAAHFAMAVSDRGRDDCYIKPFDANHSSL